MLVGVLTLAVAGTVSVMVVRGLIVMSTVSVGRAARAAAGARRHGGRGVGRQRRSGCAVFAAMTEVLANVPAVVEKLTGTPRGRCPADLRLARVIVAVPPVGGSDCGEAVTAMRAAPAAPMFTSAVLGRAGESRSRWPCRIVRPRRAALSRGRFCVCASAGSIRPSVVKNVTCVPSCTGVPMRGLGRGEGWFAVPVAAAPSSTMSEISALPFTGRMLSRPTG